MGLGEILMQVAGGINKGTGGKGVSGLLDSLGPIGALFKPNKDKTDAAGLQQQLEQTAISLQRMVESGQLDPESAIAQLKQMQAHASSISGTPELGQASQRANLVIGNVLATLQSKVVKGLSADFKTPDGQGQANLTGTGALQGERLGTGLRNYLAGSDLGSQIKGTPLGDMAGRLTKAPSNPTDKFKEISPLAEEFQPVDTHLAQRPLKRMTF